jgi:hypothetical protein
MCFGGGALRKLLEGFRQMAKDPQAVATLNNGCTQKTVRDGGSVSFVQDCNKANGALFTSHMRISGTPDEINQHSEVTLSGFGPNGSDKTIIGDMAMTYDGQCPANVKPGQVLRPDGSVFDPLAGLTAGKQRPPPLSEQSAHHQARSFSSGLGGSGFGRDASDRLGYLPPNVTSSN